MEHPTAGFGGDALRADIRLLGRVLGDTIRAQQGEATFDVVENIRRMSVEFRRHHDDDARKAFESLLNGLSREQTVEVVRAFSFFSHLANIAEDQHDLGSSSETTANGTAERVTVAAALERAKSSHIPLEKIRDVLAHALVAPVLTAHPTEVRRKSILDREIEIAQLLADRNYKTINNAETAEDDEAILRAVLTLWHTSLLRLQRPTVLDEVSNGLSYYDRTFLTELPSLYAAIEDELAGYGEAGVVSRVPTFLRMGSWIAATVTAIRSSPPMSSAKPRRCKAARRSNFISISCTSLAASCRWIAAGSRSRRNWNGWCSFRRPVSPAAGPGP